MYYNIIESGKRIKDLRKKAGMTQQELADKVGVSVNQISQVERGVRGLTVDSILLISKLLNSSVEYIATGELNIPTRELKIGDINIPCDKIDMVMRVIRAVIE